MSGPDIVAGEMVVGEIVERRPHGSGFAKRLGTYFVRSHDDSAVYAFDYTDIVTEGFRTVYLGERVRFIPDRTRPGHAIYVVKLQEPDVEDYYT